MLALDKTFKGVGGAPLLPTTRPEKRLSLTPISALLVLAVTAIVVQTWGDYDVYWHLANGRLMSQGVFPSPDRFSWPAAGRQVDLNSVEFDRVAFQVWHWFGGIGLSALSALLFVGTLLPVALHFGRLRLKLWWEAVGILFLAVTLLPYAGLRPHLIGAAILGWMALLLERPFTARKGAASGVLLAIWLNFHGSFIFGFGLLGFAVLAWFWIGDRRSAAFAAVGIVIAACSTVFSPYGIDLWKMPFQVSANQALEQHILDWRPLQPFKFGFASMGLLILMAAAVGVWRGKDPRSWAAAAFILPTMQYARFSIFSAPLLVIVLADRLVERQPRLAIDPTNPLSDPRVWKNVERAAWSLLVVGVAVVSLLGTRSLDAAVKNPVPQAAVGRMLACGVKGPVWNDYNWGGYVIWRAPERLLVGMDGRAYLYDDATLNEYFDWLDGKSGWEQTIQNSAAQYALYAPDAVDKPETLPGWRRVYADDVAVVAARAGATWTCSSTS